MSGLAMYLCALGDARIVAFTLQWSRAAAKATPGAAGCAARCAQSRKLLQQRHTAVVRTWRKQTDDCDRSMLTCACHSVLHVRRFESVFEF